MSEAKFTEGPWVKSGQFSVDIGLSGPCAEISTQGTGGVFSPVAEREANAYAIAVVPEMYAFIKKCSLAFADDYPSLRDSANELLAKARGEHE